MSNRLLTTFLAASLLAVGTAVNAQHIELTQANSTVVWRGSSSNMAGVVLDQGQISGMDGSRDLVIGAPGAAGTVGHVYVVANGNAKTGLVNLSTADAILTGASAGDQFGAMVANGNILNTEGSNPRNLLVAAPQAMGGRGVVYLFQAGFSLGANVTTSSAAYTIVGAPGDQLGTSLATADLNNDGRREIIMGAPGSDRIYIIYGSAGLSGTRNLEAQPADAVAPGAGFGSVVAAGDVTGDNIYDLLVGTAEQNAAFLYRGRTGPLPSTLTPDAGFGGVNPGDQAGYAIRLGDLDSDGIRDVQIGAPLSDGPGNARPDSGAIYVLWGSATLGSRALSTADVTIYGESAGNQLGAFFNYGDVNRDTPDDLVMSATGGAGASQLHVYYGRGRSIFGVNLGGGRRMVDLATGIIDRRIVGDASVGVIRATQVFELTGEGARDIIAGVPAATSNSGLVYFTLSPRMKLSPSALTFRVRESTAESAGIDVRNISSIAITWSATTNRPWLTVSSGNGSSVSSATGQFNIQASAAGMAPGTYTGTVTVRSTSIHLDMAPTVLVTMIVRPLTAGPLDFDGDARAEILVFRPSVGTWYLRLSSTGFGSATGFVWGAPGDVPVPGDYDGDRIIDVAVYRPQSGHWFFLKSTTNYSSNGTYQWGTTGDIPLPGDYDGDGRTDIAVYRPSNGTWYILKSSSNFTAGDGRVWGAPGDRPVPGDYDEDGKIDLGVYRPSTGHWFILLSSTNYTSWYTIQWGTTGDVLVPNDYDGDQKTDLAVYRPSNGTWYILMSSSGYSAGAGYVWGAGADVPMPADYDGDGRSDIAVYRPSSGHWFLLLSSTNYTSGGTYQWGGSSGDVPVSTQGQIR